MNKEIKVFNYVTGRKIGQAGAGEALSQLLRQRW